MTVEQTEQDRIEAIAGNLPPFARLLGVEIVKVTPDLVEAQLNVTPQLGNRNGVLHGGAISALCDNMGGTATFVNLKPGETTTTIEAKTNFFRAVQIGETIRLNCVALHKGRKTAIWQTTVHRADGKVAAISTQTQLIMQAEKKTA